MKKTQNNRFHRAWKVSCVVLAALLLIGVLPAYSMLFETSEPAAAVETIDEPAAARAVAAQAQSEEPMVSAASTSDTEPTEGSEPEAVTGEQIVTEGPLPTQTPDATDAPLETIYDPQPESVLDVWYLIQEDVIPHWEFEVEKADMPFGYYCFYVTDNPEFEMPYYTYVKVMPALTRSGGNWNTAGQTGAANDPFKIEDAVDLAKLATLVNAGNTYSGYYFVVTTDITLTGAWTPIGTASTAGISLTSQSPFSGVFDGCGYTISGLSINGSTSDLQGLFGFVSEATVKNLTVEGDVLGRRGTGMLVGTSEGSLTIDNCETRGTVRTTADSGYYVGGLIGWIDINGLSGKTVAITNCRSSADVSTHGTSSYYVGGLIGQVWIQNNSTGNNVTISNCHASGNVTTTTIYGYYVGGLAGFLEIYDSNTALNNSLDVYGCSASGNVRAGARDAGGLVGQIHNGVTIKNSWATGDVYGSANNNGGLVGYSYGYGRTNSTGSYSGDAGYCTIENSYATGNVYGGSYCTGGLIGLSDDTNVTNSFSIGNVTSPSAYSGAFIGSTYSSRISASTTVKNCYGTGTVFNSGGGGFVGYSYGTATSRVGFANCYFDKTTTQKTNPLGGGSSNTSSQITGMSTKGMIELSSWSFDTAVQDNMNGKAGGTGNDASPWYIDDDITYPYLYYQYDGHTKDEVNYYLGAVYYSNGGGFVGLDQDRADFSFPSAKSTYFQATSQGAAEVYFPYVASKYPFGAYGSVARNTTIQVPTSNFNFAAAPTLYSLGSISQSDIVAFVSVPYAEKESDRDQWQDGDRDTYTKKGDIITYEIKTTNPSTDYVWRDVSITDELPEGLTLVDGSVKITEKWTDSGGNEVTSLTTTTALGTVSGAGAYYTCTYDQVTNRWMLLVELPDHDAIDAVNGYIYSVTTQYQVLVGQDAVSMFPLANWVTENGDNIRNMGVAAGTLHLVYDETVYFEHKAEFDDENTDPVYDAYKVTYHGNGGTLADGTTTEYTEYYLLDSKYTVLPNSFDTDGDGVDDDLFQYQWHDWIDWYRTASPGVSDTPLTIGDQHEITYTLDPGTGKYTFSDVDIYAQWKRLVGSITIKKYNHGGTALPNAEFKLEKLDTSISPVVVDTTFAAQTLITDTNGSLTFSNIPLGSYQITETKAPSGYSLLTEPFRVEVPYDITLPSSLTPTDPNYLYSSTDPFTGDVTYHYFDITYEIRDQAAIIMPDSGTTGFWGQYHIWIGAALILIAVSCAVYWGKRRRRDGKRG